MLQVEQYGFDESVNVMVQPRGKFIDYKEGQASSVESAVFENVKYGHVFFVPADRDIMISFVPVKVYASTSDKQSPMGRLRIQTWYQNWVTDL